MQITGKQDAGNPSKAAELTRPAHWLKNVGAAPCGISDIGEEVAYICHVAFRGMHNAPIKYVETNWADKRMIILKVFGGFSTYDFDILTRLIVFSNDRLLRLEVNPLSNKRLELVFHQRHFRGNGNPRYERLPYLSDQIAAFGERLILDYK